MPSFARYYASRARRQCVTCGRQSATPYCPECLSRQRASNAASYQRHKARRAEEREAALLDRPHAIAHCGQWHLFASLPVRCEVCHTLLLGSRSLTIPWP